MLVTPPCFIVCAKDGPNNTQIVPIDSLNHGFTNGKWNITNSDDDDDEEEDEEEEEGVILFAKMWDSK